MKGRAARTTASRDGGEQGAGKGRRTRRSIAGLLVLVVRENSVVREDGLDDGRESRQPSAGGSRQEGARLVASGVEREERKGRE